MAAEGDFNFEYLMFLNTIAGKMIPMIATNSFITTSDKMNHIGI